MPPLLFFLLIMLLLIAAIWLFFRFQIKGKQYDERQQQMRGRGYRCGFFSMLMFDAAYLVALAVYPELAEDAVLVLQIGLFLGLLVFVVYCIRKDAFLSLRQKSGSYLLLCLFVIICNLITPITRAVRHGEAVAEIFRAYPLNCLCGIDFALIAAALALHSYTGRKADDDE